uniref:Titin n=1 Tax=Branchiostoma floridae TaxID=7739 RepID=C3YDH4_BRAFL|eukprot:XP_002605775.1 hypothetical protein BRAFLDRAFT_121886 [Branchiostoma floridae]
MSGGMKTLRIKSGNDIKLDLPISGDPPPTVTWYKDNKELRNLGRYSIRNTPISTILKVRGADWTDAGIYTLKISNELGTNKADIKIEVIGPPDPPKGPLTVSDVTAETAVLTWAPPQYDGGAEVMNYVVEKTDSFGLTWVFVNTNVQRNTIRVTGLIPDGEYKFRISAENRFGTGRPIETDVIVAKNPYDIPPSPRGVRIVDATGETIILAWRPPADDGGSEITGYIVERREKTSRRWVKVNKTPVRKLEIRSQGLVKGLEYEHRVSAVNAAGVGTPSEPTELVEIIDPVDEPTELKVTEVSRNSVSLKWTRPLSDGGSRIVTYIIERRQMKDAEETWLLCNDSNVQDTNFTVGNLLTDEVIVFRVSARNAAGVVSKPSEPTPPVVLRDEERPPVVQVDPKTKTSQRIRAGESIHLIVNVTGKPRPAIFWTKDEVDILKVSGVRATTVEKNLGPTCELYIASSERAHNGKYVIMAQNELGQASETLELVVTDRPQPPEDVEVTEITPESATVTWRPPEDDGGSDVTSYVVEKYDFKEKEWTEVNRNVRKTPCTVTRLVAGRVYKFGVRAQNMYGVSDRRATSQMEAKYNFEPPEAPDMPRPMQISKEEIVLRWNAPPADGGSPVLGYVLEKKTGTSVRWDRVNTDPIATEIYTVPTVEGGEYDFRVAAVNAAGVGKFSVSSGRIVARNIGKPGPPPSVTVVDTTRSSATVRWTQPEDKGGAAIQGYVLEVKDTTTGWRKCHTCDVIKGCNMTVTGLDPGQEYLFRVSAVNEHGQGEETETTESVEAKDRLEPPEVEVDPMMTRGTSVHAGETVHLKAGIGGRPAPEVTWSIPQEEREGRIAVDTTTKDTQLLVMNCDRTDAGRYVLTLKNSVGAKTVTFNVKVLDSPSAPVNLRVKDANKNQAVLNWDPPEKDGGSLITHYIVEKREQSRRTWGPVDREVQRNSYRVNMVEGNHYYFRVTAVNEYGEGVPAETSAPTLAADPVEVPDPPRFLEVTQVTETSIGLSWEKPDWDGGARVETYVIEGLWEGSNSWTFMKNTCQTHVTLMGLDEGMTYSIRVRAQNGAGIGHPAEVEEDIVCRHQGSLPMVDLGML